MEAKDELKNGIPTAKYAEYAKSEGGVDLNKTSPLCESAANLKFFSFRVFRIFRGFNLFGQGLPLCFRKKPDNSQTQRIEKRQQAYRYAQIHAGERL